uniref:Uncharacterized protein n=1 Tax=Hemiselmis andersenii TaxID=464988 RepID=A0A6T8LMQ1_HEMAN
MIKASPAATDQAGWRESTADFWAAEWEKLNAAKARPRSVSLSVTHFTGAVASKSPRLGAVLMKSRLAATVSMDWAKSRTGSSFLSEAGTNPDSRVSRLIRKIASKVALRTIFKRSSDSFVTHFSQRTRTV